MSLLLARGTKPVVAQRDAMFDQLQRGASGVQQRPWSAQRGERSGCCEWTPHAWALGDGAGEDVEIFRNPRAMEEYSKKTHRYVDPQDLTIGKILYFFTHEGNPSPWPMRGETRFH